MNFLLSRLRRLLVVVLVVSSLGWIAAETLQHILRSRAERLLTDIRALSVNHSTWSDVQPFMAHWSRFGSSKGPCTSDACTYQVDLMQTLPIEFIGSPDPGAKNWLPRLVDHLGLRSIAARAGFTVDHGTVITRWFGEQVTPPVRDWTSLDGYIPYLSVASTETTQFSDRAKGHKLVYPNRLALHVKTYIDVAYSPAEDSAERAALMNFNLSCITQFNPCEDEGQILPEAARLWQRQALSISPPSILPPSILPPSSPIPSR
jgi:hypothetical protein